MLKTRKIQRNYKILSSVFSLVPCLMGASCVSGGPSIEICVVSSADNGLNCVDKSGKVLHRVFVDVDGYIATPADDFEALINYCKTKRTPK